MKICVAGLGLIGGSLCMSLKRAGYFVAGYNRSSAPLQFALENNIIDEAASSFSNYDVVFVALPLKASIDFILHTPFKRGAVVADICGVKRPVEEAVYATRLPIKYIGTHPMAGKEVSGIKNACQDLFDNASMVVTDSKFTDDNAKRTIIKLTKEMGFKRLVQCTAEVHDKKIAYTSQLAHIVSNAYVKDKTIESCLGFTGGSFQDMTRIAGVDESMWSELYLANADNLAANINLLCGHLTQVNAALKSGDKQALQAVLREGREQFLNSKNNSFQGDGIKVTLLK